MAAAPPPDDVCSVCHDNFRLPCQANCAHWFCGFCILRVWNFSSTLSPCKCPICRRAITLLLPADVPEDAPEDQGQGQDTRQVLMEIERYNRLFGGSRRSLTQRLQDLPFFIRRLFGELANPSTLPLIFRARMITAMMLSALYVLSPVDFLPESVLGLFGFIDDALVILIVFLHVATIYRTLLLHRHGG